MLNALKFLRIKDLKLEKLKKQLEQPLIMHYKMDLRHLIKLLKIYF